MEKVKSENVMYEIGKLELNKGDTIVMRVCDGFSIEPKIMESIVQWVNENDRHLLMIPDGMNVTVETAETLIEQMQDIINSSKLSTSNED